MIRLLIATAFLAVSSTFAASDAWMPESRFGPKGKSVTTYIDAAESAYKKKNYKLANKFYGLVEKNTINMKNRARSIAMQGVCLAEMDKPWQAFKKYEQALDNFAGYVPFDDVLQREFDLAEAFYNGKRTGFGFFKFSTEDMAERVYNHIVKAAPYSDLAPKALYKSGLISLKLDNTQGAIEKFRRVRSRYQRSEVTADARISLAEALLIAAENADGDGSLVREANRELDRFLDRYPDHPSRERANELRVQAREQEATRLLALADFYLRPAHNQQNAARRYLQDVTANFPETTAAAEAEQRLAGLSADSDESQAAPVKSTTPKAAPQPRKTKPTPTAPAPKKTTKTTSTRIQPTVTPEAETAPLQSGEGRFLRPIENLKDYR